MTLGCFALLLSSCGNSLSPQEYINNLYQTSAFNADWTLVCDLFPDNDFIYQYRVFGVGDMPPSECDFISLKNELFEERYKERVEIIQDAKHIDEAFRFDFIGDYQWFWRYYDLGKAYDFASTMDLSHVLENDHCEVLAVYSKDSGYVYAAIKDRT